jgi:hypothetical protein
VATISVSGSGNVDITVYGNGTVSAGNGNDSINITGVGNVTVGSGNDTLTLGQGGVITEYGTAGQDTINIGAGNATVYEQGSATVTGAFGSVTMSGGTLEINQTGSGSGSSSSSSTSGHSPPSSGSSQPHGSATVSGASHPSVVGSSGQHSLVGSLAHTPRQGGMERNLFATLANQFGGEQHVIKNFVSGQPFVHIEGKALSYLTPHNNIITHDGNTHISIDGGMTRIELQGVKTADITGKH